MKNFINILIGLLACLTVNGQTITEQLILTDTKDSLYLNSDKISFDRQGNYCFVIEKGDKKEFELWWEENGHKNKKEELTNMDCFEETKLGEFLNETKNILDEMNNILDK